MPPDYVSLAAALGGLIPPSRLILDPLRRLAYGTDASFYRLIPQIVVRIEDEAEVMAVLGTCRRFGAPVTFRASGTSLSGQAVTDSVLMLLGDNWSRMVVEDGGETIRLQPGIIGAEANRKLASLARKIGPDPASIDSARIGGIAANNASGMCCGTADNSYKTLKSMRLILADGTLVDTGDSESMGAFRFTHAGLLAELDSLACATRANEALAARIRKKFAIKNTTGYSINALVDFEDPLDILQHLMIGSEGTLGFIAEITYRTIPDHPHKASALALFPDIEAACRAVAVLKQAPVAAVELMDRAALRAVEGKPGMPAALQGLADGVTALLIETRAADAAGLAANIDTINRMVPADFSTDADECGKLWKVRKGLFPAVGAVRKTGTTVIIEDVAFRIEDLAAATLDLQALFAKHGYTEAIIFGHALDGNLHFVFTQDFAIAAEIDRYGAFMDDVARLVAQKYDGSLKAEHGTGRNMAPFVEMEWGAEATDLMRRLKALIDPAGLLNPGVILNDDPAAHLANLKPLPAADPLVDTCIECGFCERMCPSHGLTLSPRQRITGWREISRLAALGNPAKEMRKLYAYQGLDTCAACGLCATACPVGIETGKLTKALRGRSLPGWQKVAGTLAARHFGAITNAARLGMRLLPNMPAPGHMPRCETGGAPVVYVASCGTRLLGPVPNDPDRRSVPEAFVSLLTKAGFHPVPIPGLDSLCCGLAFESKGMADIAETKAAEMEEALRRASNNGAIPIIMDASACTARMKERLPILDSVEFLHDVLLPRLTIAKQEAPVLVHVNCAARRMGLEDKTIAVARACAEQVVIPEGITCCGFGGDRGYAVPELNAHALRKLPQAVPKGCEAGYSTNRTCEIGLSEHSGVPYRSLIHLVDRTSQP